MLGSPAMSNVDAPSTRRRWIVWAAAGLAAVVAAAIVTFAQTQEPKNRYAITVWLEQDIDADEKAAVEAMLTRLNPVDGVQFENREQGWATFKEQFKDHPDLIASTGPESIPESFRLVTAADSFDCAILAPVFQVPGVDRINAHQLPAGDPINC